MARWAYQIIPMPVPQDGVSCTDTEERLNEHGREGWELVSIILGPNGLLYYLKKERV